MKQHVISGAVAAAVAASISVANPPKVTVVTKSVYVSKHAWPALSDADKSALADALKAIPNGVKFDIVCNNAACNDLAMDIDDAMEMAGLDSVLDHAIGPLGYGIAVQASAFDKDKAQQAAGALKKATNGRLDVPVTEAAKNTVPAGYVSIVIGKYRRR